MRIRWFTTAVLTTAYTNSVEVSSAQILTLPLALTLPLTLTLALTLALDLTLALPLT